MKRRLGGLAVAMVMATIGTVALVAYVQSAKDKALAGEQLVDVLIVTEPIAKGVAARDITAIRTVQVPAKVKAEGAVSSLAELDDLVAGARLVPGEQLIAGRFVTAVTAAQRADVPPGMLEITLSLEPQRALGGQVRVGDTVGVLASFDPQGQGGAVASTSLILHKVLVTAVQIELTPNDPLGRNNNDDDDDEDNPGNAPTPAPTGKLLVTLALDAPSVERVVFAGEHGRVWLSAEPKDAPQVGARIVTPGNVF